MTSTTITPRLKERYDSEIRDQLREQLECNVMEVPRLEKIVVNVGAGAAVDNRHLIEKIVTDMTAICGQKPVVTRAKKSIAGFKLREGNPIGVKVTLRSAQMWEFFDRLVTLAIPRVRDFRGLNPKSFDGHGNYTFGVTEQLIFPELEFDDVDRVRGLQVNIVTSAKNDAEGKRLLELLGMPFVKK